MSINNKLNLIDEVAKVLNFDWKIKAVELLRSGKSQVSIAKELHKNERTIRRMVRVLRDNNISINSVNQTS
jgi:DNA-binding NarL/FixJ family response regulator